MARLLANSCHYKPSSASLGSLPSLISSPKMSASECNNSQMNKNRFPCCVLLFSGKRKCGKDFITDILLERIGSEKAIILKISAPVKSHWASEQRLDFDKLMSAGPYKEKYRQDMIIWSDSVRAKDPGYFCREAVLSSNATNKAVWIVSDIRRKTDIQWFKQEYGVAVKTIRVWTDEDVRENRGYRFTTGVDDIASECDLDAYADWDWLIENNGDSEKLEKSLMSLITAVNEMLQHTR